MCGSEEFARAAALRGAGWEVGMMEAVWERGAVGVYESWYVSFGGSSRGTCMIALTVWELD